MEPDFLLLHHLDWVPTPSPRKLDWVPTPSPRKLDWVRTPSPRKPDGAPIPSPSKPDAIPLCSSTTVQVAILPSHAKITPNKLTVGLPDSTSLLLSSEKSDVGSFAMPISGGIELDLAPRGTKRTRCEMTRSYQALSSHMTDSLTPCSTKSPPTLLNSANTAVPPPPSASESLDMFIPMVESIRTPPTSPERTPSPEGTS